MVDHHGDVLTYIFCYVMVSGSWLKIKFQHFDVIKVHFGNINHCMYSHQAHLLHLIFISAEVDHFVEQHNMIIGNLLLINCCQNKEDCLRNISMILCQVKTSCNQKSKCMSKRGVCLWRVWSSYKYYIRHLTKCALMIWTQNACIMYNKAKIHQS